MRQFYYCCLLASGLLFGVQSIKAQTVIFSNNGASYTNTDIVTENSYGPIDISNCTSISFSVNYAFTQPFPGNGNMESSDECPFNGGCAGDPNDPYSGGCLNCWDFFYAQFQIDGSNVNTQLVGVPGSIAQSGTLTYGPICTQNASTASMIFQTNTWAVGEGITFSNITVTCWDGSAANLSVNPTPVCSGLPFSLSATLTHPASVMGTVWAGPGTIALPNSLNTSVTGAPIGTNTYTFTATDDNACTQSSTIEVTVTQGPTVNDPPNEVVCAGQPVNVVFSGTGSPVYNWVNSNPAIGLPASGSGDISFNAANVAAVTTGTITVTPTEGGCIGPSQNFTVTINPVPTMNTPANVTVCAGNVVNTIFTGTSGSTFSWTNDNTAVGLGSSGMGNISFNSALVSAQEVATITVTPTRNGCPGAPVTYTVTVNPSPTVVDPPNQVVCSGTQVDVIFSGIGSPNFNWTNSNPAIGLAGSGSGDISFTSAGVATTTTGNITVTPNSSGCPGPSQNFTITVNPVPSVNQPADVEVCAGAPISVAFTGTAGASFSWENDNTAIGLGASGIGNININAAAVGTQQVANITVTPNSTCPGNPVTFTVTVNPAPTVTDPPNQTVCPGTPVVVEFNSTGNPTLNWTNSNIAIGLGASGSGDISFTAANVPVSTTSNLTVTPIGSGCNGPAQTFTITVTPAPVVNQPGNIQACSGSTVNAFFIGTLGATFNWTNSNPSIGLGASGSGNLNFIGVNTGTTQQSATITVTPIIGTCAGAPVNFTVLIDPTPTVVDPPNQTVCAGTPVTVTFSGTNNPIFDWTNSNTATGLAASGSGDISFTATGTGVSTVTVTPIASGCPGTSQTFDITVVGSPTVTQPTNLNGCTNYSLGVTFTGTPGATFSWTNSNTAIGLGASGTGDLSFTAAAVTTPTTGIISVTPSLGGCTGTPQNFNITINPLPTITINSVACDGNFLTYDILLSTTGNNITASAGTVTGSGGNHAILDIPAGTNVTITTTNTTTNCQFQQTINAPNCNCAAVNTPTTPNNPAICEGAPIPALTVVVDAGNTVDWYSAASGGNLLLANNVSFTPTGPFTPGTYSFYAEAKEIATSCTSPSRLLVTLTVNAVPTVAEVADITICEGATVNVEFTGTASANINWTNDNTAVGLGASGSGNISFPAAFSGSLATVSVIPELNGCPGTAMTFTIDVNATPTLTLPANQTVCAGVPVSVVFSGTTGATFDWTNSDVSIGLGASGSGDIGFTAAGVSNPTISNLSVTPSLEGCPGATQNFSITVNPVPSVTDPNDEAVCSGSTVNITFNGTNGATFDWTNSDPTIGLAASGNGNISFTSTNTGNSPIIANLTVTPSQNTCTGTAQNFSITVNPIPTLTVGTTTCSGDLTTYSINVSSNASQLTSSAGTVSGSGGTFTVSGVPSGMSVVLTASNTGGGCSVQQSVAAPNCTCPPIAPPTGPNFPIICEGTATPALTVNVPAGQTADWYSAPSGGTAIFTSSTSFIPPGVFPPGTYTFYAEAREISSDCVSATRTPVVLTVNAIPTMTKPQDQTVCAGAVVSIGFSGTTGATYKWVNTNTGIGLSASGTGNISFTALNPGASPLSSSITVTPSLFGCAGSPSTFSITVNPPPTMTAPTDVTACAGQTVAVNFSAGPNATFDWTNNNTAIGLPANGSGNINFSSTDAGVAGISVTPTINGCVGTPQTFNITIVANPTMTNPGNVIACMGTLVEIDFSGNGSSYSWTNSNVTVGLPASGTGNISFVASSVNSAQSAQITVIPKAGVCSGAPQIFTITIQPLPTATISGSTSICSGDATTLTASGGSSFGWSNGSSTASIDVNPNATTTYTVTATQNGCIATASATVVVNQPTTSVVNTTTCDPAQVGTTTETITNAAGCDSIITINRTLAVLTAQATAVLAYGQYAISCKGASDATINASVTGGTAAYQYTWSVPGQSGATLTNVGAGTYDVTITDVNQCSATASVTVVDPPLFSFGIELADVECGQTNAVATLTPSGGATPFSVSIDGTPVSGGLTPRIPNGEHLVELSDAYGCVADTTVEVILPIVPEITLPPSATVTLGEPLVVEAVTNLNTWESLVWNPVPNPDCANCLTQEWVPAVSRVYNVAITDTFGCTATAFISIRVEKRVDIYIPNVFMPNLSGRNDFWVLDAGTSVLSLNTLQIFDRWGDMVYFWDAPIPVDEWPGWDGTARGKKVDPGVFVYYLEITLVNGEKVIKKGDVTVLR